MVNDETLPSIEPEILVELLELHKECCWATVENCKRFRARMDIVTEEASSIIYVSCIQIKKHRGQSCKQKPGTGGSEFLLKFLNMFVK
ncbi:hypothetical protein MAR_035926 [Mya arenaria]|uniref:Uncharacterized protein n=1 Tax=Mya arenaria TaxID=6604 RepID=A0ABY7ELI3_MYAAR|nr:hypothetical protein MAR_035926 [Mya arenaria]